MNLKITSLKTLVIGLLGVLAIGILATASVFAMRGGKYSKMMENIPEETVEEVKSIFAEGDYAALQEFMAREEVAQFLAEYPKMDEKAELITEENFSLVAEMMSLKEQMHALHEEMGWEGKKGHGWKKGDRPTAEQKEAMQAALEAGDYEAWAAAAPESKKEMVTAENFDRYVQMRALKTRMGEIKEELGFPKWGGCNKDKEVENSSA